MNPKFSRSTILKRILGPRQPLREGSFQVVADTWVVCRVSEGKDGNAELPVLQNVLPQLPCVFVEFILCKEPFNSVQSRPKPALLAR